jgi:hypothetical protein
VYAVNGKIFLADFYFLAGRPGFGQIHSPLADVFFWAIALDWIRLEFGKIRHLNVYTVGDTL